MIQQMYDIAVDAVDVRRKIFLGGMMSRNPEAILRRSVRILELLQENLQQLRSLCNEYAGKFSSDGFRELFAMVADQLSDDYLSRLSEQLRDLQLPNGVLLSAQLGPGNKGKNYVLHQAPHRNWWES